MTKSYYYINIIILIALVTLLVNTGIVWIPMIAGILGGIGLAYIWKSKIDAPFKKILIHNTIIGVVISQLAWLALLI